MRIRCVAAELRHVFRFRRLTERVWRLGPRPCAEAMLAIADGQDPTELLESLAEQDPQFVRYVGARDWPPSVWGLSV